MAIEQPILTFETGTAWIDLFVVNGGSAVLTNAVEKREGTSGSFVRVAIIGPNGTYRDYAVKSSTAYQYRIRANSATEEALSSLGSTPAPKLVGTWLHDPADVGTLRNFMFADSERSETLDIVKTGFQFVGRARRVFEFSEYEEGSVSIDVFVPFGNAHDAGVRWWRNAMVRRRVVLYRDGRGRMVYGILDGVTITDKRAGSSVKTQLLAADYDEAV